MNISFVDSCSILELYMESIYKSKCFGNNTFSALSGWSVWDNFLFETYTEKVVDQIIRMTKSRLIEAYTCISFLLCTPVSVMPVFALHYPPAIPLYSPHAFPIALPPANPLALPPCKVTEVAPNYRTPNEIKSCTPIVCVSSTLFPLY